MKSRLVKILGQWQASLRQVCDKWSVEINTWSIKRRKSVLISVMVVAGIILFGHWLYCLWQLMRKPEPTPNTAVLWREAESQFLSETPRIERIIAPLDSHSQQTLNWLYEENQRILEEEEKP